MRSSLINLLDYLQLDIVKVIILGFLLLRNLSSIMFRLDREKLKVRLLIEICRLLGFRLGYFSTLRLINLMLSITMLEKIMRIRFCQLFVTRFWGLLLHNSLQINCFLKEIKYPIVFELYYPKELHILTS